MQPTPGHRHVAGAADLSGFDVRPVVQGVGVDDDVGSVSTRQNSAMPPSAYSPGLANRSVFRLDGLTTSTTSPTSAGPTG